MNTTTKPEGMPEGGGVRILLQLDEPVFPPALPTEMRTGSGWVGSGLPMVWNDEGGAKSDAATLAVTFEHWSHDGILLESEEIDGDDWREIEDNDEEARMLPMLAAGVPLKKALDALIEHNDPDGYYEDEAGTREELDRSRALLARCEAFIAGFEDDEAQGTGPANVVPSLLSDLRATIGTRGDDEGHDTLAESQARDAAESMPILRIAGNAYAIDHGTLMCAPVHLGGGIPAFDPAGEWAEVEAEDDRTRQARSILQAAPALRSILAQVNAHDAAMDDEANSGTEAQPPEGDDYNDVVQIVRHEAAKVLDPQRAPEATPRPTDAQERQAAFTRELVREVLRELLTDITAGKLPEEWNGIELRALIAHRFDRARMGAETDRKRWNAFRNELIVRNL